MEYKYGYFNEAGDEFIITSPATPRPFDNFLFNDSCYANVHQTGIGCFDYQIDGKEGIQLYTGNFIEGQTGKNGHKHVKHEGFCLETQYFPNAINETNFVCPITEANVPYKTKTVYAFSVR